MVQDPEPHGNVPCHPPVEGAILVLSAAFSPALISGGFSLEGHSFSGR